MINHNGKHLQKTLKNSDIKNLTGVSNSQIKKYLLKMDIIKRVNKKRFYFKDIYEDQKYFYHMEKRTVWKVEAKSFLKSISKECKIDIYNNIFPSFVLPNDLPFIRFQSYQIKILRLEEKYMLIDSILGTFRTTLLFKNSRLEEGGIYKMTMKDRSTKIVKT